MLRPKQPYRAESDADDDQSSVSGRAHSRHSGSHLDALLDQVTQWIKEERTKQRGDEVPEGGGEETDGATDVQTKKRGEKIRSAVQSFDLDKLENIIKQNLHHGRRSRNSRAASPSYLRKGSLAKPRPKLPRASSDTDYFGNEPIVPSCDVVLDNSKTMSYTGGASDDSETDSDELHRTTTYRDRDEWARFKFEIVRLTHTLRLRRWRRVSLDMSNSVHVQRLSGALTNAVYVVSPPSDLPEPETDEKTSNPRPKAPPPKLLLRVYGPQVEHLIDREIELAILCRLARKRIGPRLLGTFANGRFEEFFYAETLTPKDLRDPDTSRRIAKRMRELHDGIELLDQERDDGPFVWRNWDKWVPRVEQVVTWLDCQVMKLPPGTKPTGPDAWKRRGFICGVPWKQFYNMVNKYREWLREQYGSDSKIKEQLVFAHNDTQYGNILRLKPAGESPLMLPQNTHKQLVVIDFEYANANLVGLEFANHFTEWCYDYHDEKKPYAFHPNRYPTPEEQDRFVRAYVQHRPEYNISTPRMTPASTPKMSSNESNDHLSRRPTSSISDFMLDARTPSLGGHEYVSEEAARKTAEDQEVARLLHETRLWRLANTAQWVTWGIVQAKVPGMPDFSSEGSAEPEREGEDASREDLGERADEYRELIAQQQKQEDQAISEDVVEEEFDYLGYAQHRALFFWADAMQLGLVKPEELPAELMEKVKVVPY